MERDRWGWAEARLRNGQYVSVMSVLVISLLVRVLTATSRIEGLQVE